VIIKSFRDSTWVPNFRFEDF